jgi:hypothetical protein
MFLHLYVTVVIVKLATLYIITPGILPDRPVDGQSRERIICIFLLMMLVTYCSYSRRLDVPVTCSVFSKQFGPGPSPRACRKDSETHNEPIDNQSKMHQTPPVPSTYHVFHGGSYQLPLPKETLSEPKGR